MQYEEDGYLPEALLNYLARLGWSHGDDEVFSVDQLVQWFTLDHCSKSAAQFDFEKLKWLNNHYLRQLTGDDLASRIDARIRAEGVLLANGPPLAALCDLLKDRAQTLVDLAEEAAAFFMTPPEQSPALAEHMQAGVAQALGTFLDQLPSNWEASALSACLKKVLTETGLKMPQLAMPLRLMLMGRLETPSIDRVMLVLGRERVVARIRASLAHYR